MPCEEETCTSVVPCPETDEMSKLEEVFRKGLGKKEICRQPELGFGEENLWQTNIKPSYYSVLMLKGDASKKNKNEQRDSTTITVQVTELWLYELSLLCYMVGSMLVP